MATDLLPMVAVRKQIGSLLAADPTTLAPAGSANKIALIMAPFTLTEDLVVGDLTLATFATSTPIAGATGAQGVSLDPATGDQVITVLDPVGGYRYVVTATTNLPQAIYGCALLDTTLANLLAVALFATPVNLTTVGQAIDLGPLVIDLLQNPFNA